MTKDEALQMCLEYIETDAHERKYVHHAIKQALAAPVQEPVAYLHQCRKKPELKELSFKKHEPALFAKGYKAIPLADTPPPAQPAPVQEPVAWMYPDDYERMLTSETFCTVYSVEVGSATRGESSVALYTTPPAAQPAVPLTNDEVDRAIDQIDQNAINWTQELFKFARAIEAKLKENNI